MENPQKLDQLLPEVTKSMQSLTPSTLQKELNEISVFTGETATSEETKSEIRKLAAAFPDITNDFIILLAERITENKFTKERVRQAVNHVIDTNPYKRPSIADIISFDKKIKLLTWEQVAEKCSPGNSAFDNHVRIMIEGQPRYYEK